MSILCHGCKLRSKTVSKKYRNVVNFLYGDGVKGMYILLLLLTCMKDLNTIVIDSIMFILRILSQVLYQY